jgi:lactate 2-monooxygenase
MVMGIDGTKCPGMDHYSDASYGHQSTDLSHRPRTEEVTLSLLDRAKTNGFTALLLTFEAHGVGWRPHDLELGYHPYSHGIGSQVGKSDPIFMARYNRSPVHERPEFPYDPRNHEKYVQSGDHEMTKIGLDWTEEVNSAGCHSWEDLVSLKKLWEGPLIVKGIMNVFVSLIFIIHCFFV